MSLWFGGGRRGERGPWGPPQPSSRTSWTRFSWSFPLVAGSRACTFSALTAPTERATGQPRGAAVPRSLSPPRAVGPPRGPRRESPVPAYEPRCPSTLGRSDTATTPWNSRERGPAASRTASGPSTIPSAGDLAGSRGVSRPAAVPDARTGGRRRLPSSSQLPSCVRFARSAEQLSHTHAWRACEDPSLCSDRGTRVPYSGPFGRWLPSGRGLATDRGPDSYAAP